MRASYRCVVLAGLVILTGLSATQVASAQSDGTFSRTLNVSGPVDLDVSTGSGHIEIRSGSSNRVEVRGNIHVNRYFWITRRSNDIVRDIESHPPIEQSGSTVRIGRLDNSDSYRDVSISYEITVPANTRVRSRTGSGSQEVSDVEGPVDASTGSGTIRLANVRKDVSANTGSGGIVAEGIHGAFRGRTGSGRISVDGDPGGRWDVETGSGSVTVRMPQQAAFDLNAHTGSGSVSIDRPISVRGSIRRNSISGTVRGGGVAMDLRTGSGSIRVE